MMNHKTTQDAIASVSPYMDPDTCGLFGAIVNGIRFEFWFNPYNGWQFNSVR